MLDIKFIRENPKRVQQSCQNKQTPIDINRLLELDEERRKLDAELSALRQKRNDNAAKMKSAPGKPDPQLIEEGKQLKEEIAQKEEAYNIAYEAYETLLASVLNVHSDDTPIGKDEDENVIVHQVGTPKEFDFTPKEHFDISAVQNLIDKESAAKVSWSRFAYLMGDIARMQYAIIQMTLNELCNPDVIASLIDKHGLQIPKTPYIPVIPPVIMRQDVMHKMARLDPPEDKYLIPKDEQVLVGSAEHTMGSMFMDHIFEEEELPIRYLGISTAFRREAGSAGKDTRGILRMHQFDKIEMESFCSPEFGYEEQKLMVAVQEHLVQKLGIPYQLISICTGDMGGPDVKQMDIECYMPGQGVYRETHTSDYMGDYQSRRLKTRVRSKDGETQYVHMNDATAFAIGRILIAILENYQNKDGSVTIPDILQPFMGGKDKIEAK